MSLCPGYLGNGDRRIAWTLELHTRLSNGLGREKHRTEMWQHGEGIGLLGWSGWYRRSREPRGMASEAVSTGTANPSRLLRWDSRHSGPHQWGKLFRADDLVMKGQVYVSRRAGFLSRTSTQSLKWAWGWPVQGVKGNASLSFIVPHFRGWPERIFPSLSCICNTVSTGKWSSSVEEQNPDISSWSQRTYNSV